MENWTGSKVYEMVSSEPNEDEAAAEEESTDLTIEIQIKILNFNGVPSRLVVIRNVNYIVEQQ